MNEFKFACPSCHQNIKIAAEFESRRIDCPSCNIKLIVPAPPKDAGTAVMGILAQPAARLEAEESPFTNPETTAPQLQSASEKPKPIASDDATAKPGAPAASLPVTTVPPINDRRVAVLTPKLKLEIVRAVQSRIADKSRWLPGKKAAGEYDYAARREGEELVKVSPTDASATHLSLFGAMMLEFHRHNVLRGTTGRQQFLDVDLLEAIQEVLDKEPGETPSEAERDALTHPQCLAVMKVLEARYQLEAERAKKREQERKIDYVRLADLIKKLETGNPLKAEEVACALYHELEELNQRLEQLERSAGKT